MKENEQEAKDRSPASSSYLCEYYLNSLKISRPISSKALGNT